MAAGLPSLRLELPPLPSVPAHFLAGFPTTDPGRRHRSRTTRPCLTFTSGSTGKPKGVVGRHGPLTHFYPWMGERFGLCADDRFGMLSALSHDPLQRDLFTPLWFGAAIVRARTRADRRARLSGGWLRRERSDACST